MAASPETGTGFGLQACSLYDDAGAEAKRFGPGSTFTGIQHGKATFLEHLRSKCGLGRLNKRSGRHEHERVVRRNVECASLLALSLRKLASVSGAPDRMEGKKRLGRRQASALQIIDVEGQYT